MEGELERPDGGRIAYEVRGEGRALVLIHGGFVSRRSWSRELEVFSGSYRVVAVDLRGHGGSSRAPRYSVEQMAGDVEALMDELGLERASVCGHSLGGMVAMQLARRSARVEALILMDTSYSTSATRWEAVQTWAARATFSLFSVSQVARWTESQTGAQRADAGAYVREEMMTHADDRRHYLAMWDAVFAFDARGWLEQVRADRVLVVIAGLNEATHEQGRVMGRRIPGARVVEVAGAGHMVNWDRPEESERLVRAELEALG